MRDQRIAVSYELFMSKDNGHFLNGCSFSYVLRSFDQAEPFFPYYSRIITKYLGRVLLNNQIISINNLKAVDFLQQSDLYKVLIVSEVESGLAQPIERINIDI